MSVLLLSGIEIYHSHTLCFSPTPAICDFSKEHCLLLFFKKWTKIIQKTKIWVLHLLIIIRVLLLQEPFSGPNCYIYILFNFSIQIYVIKIFLNSFYIFILNTHQPKLTKEKDLFSLLQKRKMHTIGNKRSSQTWEIKKSTGDRS